MLDYLRAGGMAEEKIATVYAPAGLHLGASTPEEIALSVMSQMVALRRGGNAHSAAGCRPLREVFDGCRDSPVRGGCYFLAIAALSRS